MTRQSKREGFTLVEMLIVVLILGILGMVVVPKFSAASEDARESRLLSDIQAVRRLIELYRMEHGGRLPHLNESGASDQTNFQKRLMSRTTHTGAFSIKGTCGPYLRIWPTNPYLNKDKAGSIKFGAIATPPRDDSTGWYYSLSTGLLWPNSSKGGDSLFAAPAAEPAAAPAPVAIPIF